MSKRVFQVKYQEKWDDTPEYLGTDTVNVLAVDAERAIVAARKHVIGKTYRDDEDNKKLHRVTAFRLLGVESVVTVDVG